MKLIPLLIMILFSSFPSAASAGDILDRFQNRVTVVAVGKEKAVADQLEKLGRVTVMARP
jgi:hypothetical protein